MRIPSFYCKGDLKILHNIAQSILSERVPSLGTGKTTPNACFPSLVESVGARFETHNPLGFVVSEFDQVPCFTYSSSKFEKSGFQQFAGLSSWISQYSPCWTVERLERAPFTLTKAPAEPPCPTKASTQEHRTPPRPSTGVAEEQFIQFTQSSPNPIHPVVNLLLSILSLWFILLQLKQLTNTEKQVLTHCS